MPRYKVSTTLINKWLNYKAYPSVNNLEQLKEAIVGVYRPNFWTERGTDFELDVSKGKHGKLSDLIMPLKKQVWCKTFLTVNGLDVKLSGKLDAIDENKKTIYDIKRTNKFDVKKYDDDATSQHTFYYYMNPEVEHFYYLIAYGEDDSNIEVKALYRKRPSDEELEKKVINYISGFFEFLEEHNLMEDYKKNQQTKEYKDGVKILND